jgi:hypothetical protein
MANDDSLERAGGPAGSEAGSPPRLRVVSPAASSPVPTPSVAPVVAFDRLELSTILNLYGRKVAAGEWRDYAIDFGKQAAVFSIFRRTSEIPLFRIEKDPRLARKQGAYAVIAAGGRVLKRGSDLARVISILDKTVRLVGS